MSTPTTQPPGVLWRNAHLATCDAQDRVIEKGALVTRAGLLEWVGEERTLPLAYAAAPGGGWTERDLGGAWVTPGLIDCHTHLVFAGTRAQEYGERLRGVSYEEIARRGGGILSTMRAVRQAGIAQLYEESAPRLVALAAEGVTTVEIKSGYGLTLQDEAKMLRVARMLAQELGVRVCTTFLAAHTVPPEFQGRADDYIDEIGGRWLPALKDEGLVDAVDIFCEAIAFTTAQAARLFEAAQRLGLPVKMHAEQLTNIGGTLLACQHRALSCDHLEHAGEAEAAAMAASGTVAVLLPQAWYCLQGAQPPPIPALRKAGTAMAVATDCNPGSAPGASLLTTMSMATRLFGLTPAEALAGVTRHAAKALGLQHEIGTLEAGKAADFVIWRIGSLDELGYWIGFNPGASTVRGGTPMTLQVAGGAINLKERDDARLH